MVNLPKFAGKGLLRKDKIKSQLIKTGTPIPSNFNFLSDGNILPMQGTPGDWDRCNTFKRCCADDPRNRYCCRRIPIYCEE